jgi:acetylornithine/N-succinyldiaminopimelate aminotransferase
MIGNNTAELLSAADNSVLFTSIKPDLVMEKGQGMYLWDTEGNQYLDFIGGWGTNCLGHCPEVITRALQAQTTTLVNCSPAFYNKPQLEFAQLLTQASCFDRVFFTSTGAEANEGAIKLARKYGNKILGGAYEIITTQNGFHGRTLATMSATGKTHWKSLYAPKVSGFIHVPYNDLDAITEAVNPNTCAIMLELVQGEGGVHPANPEYITGLRKLCDEKGIMLIFDEVQTGFGRTGKLFAYEHYGIEPDVMTLAKGIGGGFPLSALLVKEKYNIFEVGDQGGTYTGQPLAMAVGLAVASEVIGKYLWENAEKQGRYIMDKLSELSEDLKLRNIRGLGLLIGMDLPDASAIAIVSECLKEGLIINTPNPTTLRLMPPLIVKKEECDKMLAILARVLKQYYSL